VLELKKAKNEDMIALILSKNEIKSYYRFYGARHSILQVGYLVDFENDDRYSSFMPQLRSLSHIGFSWLKDRNRLLLWHNFISAFIPHLRDTNEIDTFYFDLLLEAAQKWGKQNPKRVACESYIQLLKFEGRLNLPERCYICDGEIQEDVALMQALKPAHPECIYTASINKEKLLSLYENGSSLYLEDDDVAYLFDVLLKGF
jgi:hypothetical protein